MRVRLRVWLLWWVLAPCVLCGGCGFLPFPFGCGNELGGDGGGCFLVVCELCGWACCPLLIFSAVSYCIRCAPSPFLLFHCLSFWLTDQLTDSSDSTTGGDGCDDDDGDGAAPCGVRRDGPCTLVVLLLVRVCVAAAGSPGNVSGDADAVVVPVDVSCAPSDGSLRYRVPVFVYGSGRSVLLPVLRLSMRTVLSVALMCACMAGMVSWVLCAMWPMRCTHVATVLPAVQRRRKGPPLPPR
ncbi:hypothetical protein ECC02_010903 [Trypanosoma cruzi]|uniref:Mucin TcMUCII n=1 Tax=Trypanosoma cruzi TaxID=5693 RepID=A0A7J6XQ38_TRYCR|nr:hypothetical protein ECC02_010903 [Trypanosoma cruzi]